MSKANQLELDILNYILNGVAPSWAAAASLYVSLHTADPGEAGSQMSSEATYTGYARVQINRSGGVWTVANGSGLNGSEILFGVCTAGNNTITHFGLGTALSGAGVLLYSGSLAIALNVTTNIQPLFDASTITITED